MNAIYFDTLAQTVDAAVAEADQRGAVLARPTEAWALAQDHLACGLYRRGDFQLAEFRGKPTKKYYHVVIYRLDSGRYELTAYVL